MLYNTKGFTLIELLLVIAVIGILSGIVTLSLIDTNNDTKIRILATDSKRLFPIATLHFDERGSYKGFCDDVGVKEYINLNADSGCNVSDDGLTWVVWLKQEKTDVWQCVDSILAKTSTSKSISTKPTNLCE